MNVTKALIKLSGFADVSVVIPCYRCKNTIKRALDSVYNQTILPAEVILVEDASNDGTLEYLNSISKEYSAGWIKVIPLEVNSGPGTARNVGWNASSQPYVAFLDSDDSWHPQKIEIQYLWMEQHPHVALTGQMGVVISDAVDATSKCYPMNDVVFSEISKFRLLLSNKFSTPSVLIRREVQYRFTAGKRFCEDYELWCKVVCAGHICFAVNLPLTFCYKPLYGHAGLSGDLWNMESGELSVYNVLRKNGSINMAVAFFLKAWSLIRYGRRIIRIKFVTKLS
ncbi:glycosyltransferase [Pseudomonas sp. MAFF 311095]|uniref:Glycosyltransferase n=1 Tax=Pseudomonas petroselini TaxID=2899822 RepID=A0ABS8QY97_9PSED|nr:glycosyltransferase family 2 protein [Pseudomonas petroselini]MCD7040373.1 glycosyltransferase [Pseudomonas petroselini]MCD7045590.1 glycosyltransferase [Pseudomonas petroselini]MCD7069011.1 glycosyltransferase [Pseudomonas petroselini]MCD7079640.1 glycosyltransferase [Pseudomonas petroselini]